MEIEEPNSDINDNAINIVNKNCVVPRKEKATVYIES